MDPTEDNTDPSTFTTLKEGWEYYERTFCQKLTVSEVADRRRAFYSGCLSFDCVLLCATSKPEAQARAIVAGIRNEGAAFADAQYEHCMNMEKGN